MYKILQYVYDSITKIGRKKKDTLSKYYYTHRDPVNKIKDIVKIPYYKLFDQYIGRQTPLSTTEI